MGQIDTAQTGGQGLGTGGGASPPGDVIRPDSILRWTFQALGGPSWGGFLIADSDRFAVGDIIATRGGSYTILAEEVQGADLTPFGFEDGEVFIEWYWAPRLGRFLPTRNGTATTSGKDGLGSEFDHVWTDTVWAGFGLGGQVLADVAPSRADTLFTFTFEASSGDRWMGELHDLAHSHAAGDTLVTAFGTYRIIDAAPIDHRLIEIGSVNLTGTYFDHASGASLAIQGPSEGAAHGLDGLGSERGLAWTGRHWADFGHGGAMQAEVPAEFRPAIRGFGFEGHAGGWVSQDRYPRMLADVNGDGRMDVLGFGNEGALVALATRAGGFDAAYFAVFGFGFTAQAGGWSSQDRFPRMLGDVNGDGRADVVGFGNAGAWVAPADGRGGFEPAYLAANAFGFLPQGGGWESQYRYPRMLGDVNGDGRADIVGFGNAGVWVSLADGGGGFGPGYLAATGFGFLPRAGGWESQDRFPRMLVDVNGDRRADIVGFGNDGAWVSLADGSGGFGPAYLAVFGFGFGQRAGGWASQDRFPRLMADVSGDGRADIVGFGNAGTWVSVANPSGGFDPARLVTSAFGAQSAGWSRQDAYPRVLGDFNGDGRADVVGFGNAGVWADPWIGYG
jgi:hypothetical protein